MNPARNRHQRIRHILNTLAESSGADDLSMDTHIFRLSRCIGFTRRAVPGWNTALEITVSLRRFDPEDPIRYDFSLCTPGKRQACPAIPSFETCSDCDLNEVCLLTAGGRRISNRTAELSGRLS